ncbi:class I SAM-dependent methyltransferase [bacterium]|nr:class I SAM-dependent methyltransferase [bacterium]
MEPREYARMFRMEDDYWWYRGLRDIVIRSVFKFSRPSRRLRILDAGCGTGRLLSSFRGAEAWGIDSSPYAFEFLKIRGLKNAVRASVCDIPFKDMKFSMVLSLDVLYHSGVKNDDEALSAVVARDGIPIWPVCVLRCKKR